MAQVRIYVVYRAHKTRAWHVSLNGADGESYASELLALHAACERVRVMEKIGNDVTVLQEDAGGV
ncbi:hypothetical protein [Luteibacter aegosomatissinici]|uniref:hypothetical protein n=1 Tax=Luteibacter aegosomatissinici TaxID=2911539 RepID=UPI001FFA6C2D|nr:hypothetical protein [Luteibacter aegosomatissinici]UPG92774.1 hypothetical protein L2Y97_12955 [Luteibacter aegosomatissinici]